MSEFRIKVFGPPGCGKSTFINTRIKEALGRGTMPQRILSCSFTRTAAYHNRDLVLEAFPEYNKEDFPHFATLHSIAFRLLGLNKGQVFNLADFARDVPFYKFTLDYDDTEQLLEDYSTETAADYAESFLHWKRHKMIPSRAAYRLFRQYYPEPPGFFTLPYLELYLERRAAYKAEHSLWDFEDMIESCLESGLSPDIDLFLSDESQDMSPLIMELAKLWSSRAEQSFYVGDAYQALYEFSGGDPALMIDLPADDSFTLGESFRCPRAVHELSRKVVEKFGQRYPDDDFQPADRDGRVRKAGLASATLNYPGKTFYLFRTRYLLERVFDSLYDRGVPFVTTKRCRQSPLSKKERLVSEVLLRLIQGDSVSLSQIENILDRIPSKTARVEFIKRGVKADLKRRIENEKEAKHRVTRESLPFLGFTSSFMGLLNKHDFVELIRTEEEIKNYFRRLLSIHGPPVFLKAPDLTLSTIHGVKGLEADNVLLSLEMTRRPWENLERDPDSEGRVYYVGITRAKENLELLIPEDLAKKCLPPETEHIMPDYS